MSSRPNEEQQLLALLKQYGIEGTSIALQILNAWRNWDDINGDIASFIQHLKRYKELSEYMKNMEKEFINSLNSQINAMKQQEEIARLFPLNMFSSTCSNDNLTSDDLLKRKEELIKEFEELKEKFGDANNIELQKDKLLERSQVFEILGLVATWVEIFQGYFELKNNSKELKQHFVELKRIETDYIQPVFEILKKESRVDEGKIECAMMQLRILKTELERQQEIALQATIKHGVGAVSNGFAVASSAVKIVSLGTNSWPSIIQWGIGIFQGAAVVSHAGLAIWAGKNYYEYKYLINQINIKYDTLSELKAKMKKSS